MNEHHIEKEQKHNEYPTILTQMEQGNRHKDVGHKKYVLFYLKSLVPFLVAR